MKHPLACCALLILAACHQSPPRLVYLGPSLPRHFPLSSASTLTLGETLPPALKAELQGPPGARFATFSAAHMGYGAEAATAFVDDSGRIAYLTVRYVDTLTPQALVEHFTHDLGLRPDTLETGGAGTCWEWSDRETVARLCGHQLQWTDCRGRLF